MFDRELILRRYRGEERDVLARAVDLGEMVVRTHQPQVTDFYDPYHTGLIISTLESVIKLALDADGGYPGAERSRVIIYPDYFNIDDVDTKLAFLNIQGNFRMAKLNHRDFLGSLLGTGLKREKIGDILVMEDCAQVVVAQEVAQYILMNLSRVGRLGVTVKQVERNQLNPPELRVKEIRTTVPSLRVDVIAAAGFGTSRTRMSREILAERINLNWKTCSNLSHPIQEGDILSARGRGRVEVAEVKGNTKSGRLGVVLKRYI